MICAFFREAMRFMQNEKEGSERNFSFGKGAYILAGLVFLIVTLGFFAKKWSSNQRIKSVKVEGNRVINDEDALKCALDTIKDYKEGDIDLNVAKKKLEKHPYVASAEVIRKNSNEIVIKLKEKEPFAALLKPDGTLVYLDFKGEELPYESFYSKADAPIIRGAYKYGLPDSSIIKPSLEFLKKAKELGSIFDNISEISILNGSFEFISADNGARAILGDTTRLSEKIKKFDKFWRYSLQNSTARNYKIIDLRWSKRVIVS